MAWGQKVAVMIPTVTWQLVQELVGVSWLVKSIKLTENNNWKDSTGSIFTRGRLVGCIIALHVSWDHGSDLTRRLVGLNVPI